MELERTEYALKQAVALLTPATAVKQGTYLRQPGEATKGPARKGRLFFCLHLLPFRADVQAFASLAEEHLLG